MDGELLAKRPSSRCVWMLRNKIGLNEILTSSKKSPKYPPNTPLNTDADPPLMFFPLRGTVPINSGS